MCSSTECEWHTQQERSDKKTEKYVAKSESLTKKRVPETCVADEALLRGCNGCPCNHGHTKQKSPYAGPKDPPKVRVKCKVLGSQMVSTFSGDNHENCPRRHHVMNKKMDPAKTQRHKEAGA